MVLWDTSLPSFWSACFLNKVIIPWPPKISRFIGLLCGKLYKFGHGISNSFLHTFGFSWDLNILAFGGGLASLPLLGLQLVLQI